MALHRTGGRGQVRMYVIGSALAILAHSRKLSVNRPEKASWKKMSLKLSLEKIGEVSVGIDKTSQIDKMNAREQYGWQETEYTVVIADRFFKYEYRPLL